MNDSIKVLYFFFLLGAKHHLHKTVDNLLNRGFSLKQVVEFVTGVDTK